MTCACDVGETLAAAWRLFGSEHLEELQVTTAHHPIPSDRSGLRGL